MKKVVVGLALIVIGCLTLILWWKKLMLIVMGIMPIVLIVGGMLTLSAGIRHIENQKIKSKTVLTTRTQNPTLIKPSNNSEPKTRAIAS